MFKNHRISASFLALNLTSLFSPVLLWAQGNEMPSAESILIAARKRMYAAKDQSAQLTFRVVDVNGAEDRRVYRFFWKNYGGQNGLNSKSLFVTELPIKEKGEKFLVWEYVDESQSDQWIYLPELRQIRRVHPNRHQHDGESHSDFSMDDVRQRRISKDTHQLLPEETIRDISCYVVESRPLEDSPYGRMIFYISKEDHTLQKALFFSEDGDLVKTQWISWDEIGGVFVWKQSEMINARSGHKTVVILHDIQIDKGLRDDQFSERALRR